MKVRLWGTRGSVGAAGPETVRYGGNTACVEVRATTDHLVVLDAGTGIRRLGSTIGPEVRRIDILLTHLHMDHVQGLGFFAPLFLRDAEVHIWGPPSISQSLRDRLTRYLSAPLFPVALRDLDSQPEIHNAPIAEPMQLRGLQVLAGLVIHPGPTVGYRVSTPETSIAYIPDHEPAIGSRHFPEHSDWTSGMALATGANLLIHDAQYTDREYAERVGWGHSTVHHAVLLAELAGVHHLVTFHHDPSHDDRMLDAMLGSANSTAVEVIGGREGLELDASVEAVAPSRTQAGHAT